MLLCIFSKLNQNESVPRNTLLGLFLSEQVWRSSFVLPDLSWFLILSKNIHRFYTNLPVRLYRSKPVSAPQPSAESLSYLSVCGLMACSFLNFRARRRQTLTFFLSRLTAKQTNRQVLSTCLSSLGPFPGVVGSAGPAVTGLKGFVLFCWQDDQWLVCDAGKRWPGPHSRRERGGCVI